MKLKTALLLGSLLAGATHVCAAGKATVASSPATEKRNDVTSPSDRRSKNAVLQQALRAVKESPKSSVAWLALGQARHANGQQRAAIKAFNRALKFSPHLTDAFVGRGQVFEAKGRADEAVNEYRAALLSDPRSPAALEALARLKDHAPEDR